MEKESDMTKREKRREFIEKWLKERAKIQLIDDFQKAKGLSEQARNEIIRPLIKQLYAAIDEDKATDMTFQYVDAEYRKLKRLENSHKKEIVKLDDQVQEMDKELQALNEEKIQLEEFRKLYDPSHEKYLKYAKKIDEIFQKEIELLEQRMSIVQERDSLLGKINDAHESFGTPEEGDRIRKWREQEKEKKEREEKLQKEKEEKIREIKSKLELQEKQRRDSKNKEKYLDSLVEQAGHITTKVQLNDLIEKIKKADQDIEYLSDGIRVRDKIWSYQSTSQILGDYEISNLTEEVRKELSKKGWLCIEKQKIEDRFILDYIVGDDNLVLSYRNISKGEKSFLGKMIERKNISPYAQELIIKVKKNYDNPNFIKKLGSKIDTILNSRKLPVGLPGYAYKVDKKFKYEIRDKRNPEMMKKIDEAVLKMREEGILKTKSKDGGVYTIINFPKEKPIHFLEPDLTKYSDEEYKSRLYYSFGGKKVHKDEVKLGGMRGKVDEWENKKLKQYVKQSGLSLPKELEIKEFMQKLADFVNSEYKLNISSEKEQIDLFCRAMNSIGYFWLADYQNSSRSCFECSDNNRGFNSIDYINYFASFFLTDYLL